MRQVTYHYVNKSGRHENPYRRSAWLRRGLRVAVIAGLALKLATGSIVSTYAAGGTLFGVNVTGPAGGALVDGHFWTSDHAGAFCRMDLGQNPAPAGIYGEAICYFDAIPGTQDKPNQMGQPTWDTANNLVYLPDYRSNSLGVWRFPYNASTQTLGLSAQMAPNQGLGGIRPDATALGPDGNLYVGFLNTGDIKRITNPAGPPSTQTVQTIGKSILGKRVFGLAFVGSDLYLAETSGLTVIHNATSPNCTGGCQAARVPGSAAVETDGVVSNGTDTVYFIQSPAVHRYTISNGSIVAFANSGTIPPGYTGQEPVNCTGTTCPFLFPSGEPSGVSLDSQGNLYVGDDPGLATGLIGTHGRIWKNAAGSVPIG